MAEKPLPHKNSRTKLILILILALILLAAGVYLYAGWLGYQEAPMLVEVQNSPASEGSPYPLSPAQAGQISSIGYPEAFTILYYEEELPQGGIQTVRLESWDYYSLGLGLTFVNGELASEDPLEVGDLGEMSRLPYRPEQFQPFMSLEEVIAAAGFDTYAEIPLQDGFMDEGILYYADSLAFGLQDGQLVYLEALALIEN